MLGTIFRISTNGALTQFWVFAGGTNGSSPDAGLVQASEFIVKQKVLASMPWKSTAAQTGYDLSGTALQILCGPDWNGCLDSTIPLAETTIGLDGVFQVMLPDWSTR